LFVCAAEDGPYLGQAQPAVAVAVRHQHGQLRVAVREGEVVSAVVPLHRGISQRWGRYPVCSEGIPGSECFSTLGFGFQTHSGTDVTRNLHGRESRARVTRRRRVRATKCSRRRRSRCQRQIPPCRRQNIISGSACSTGGMFTHRLGQRQASVLAARVVEVRLVKNS
jgi:hypothetical protein